MSISPQLVCITSVAGLGMCCAPLLVGFAGLHSPPDPPAVVPVALGVLFADVDVEVVELLLPHPAMATARTAASRAGKGRDMGAQDNQGSREAVPPPRRLRQRAPGPRRLRL